MVAKSTDLDQGLQVHRERGTLVADPLRGGAGLGILLYDAGDIKETSKPEVALVLEDSRQSEEWLDGGAEEDPVVGEDLEAYHHQGGERGSTAEDDLEVYHQGESEMMLVEDTDHSAGDTVDTGHQGTCLMDGSEEYTREADHELLPKHCKEVAHL